jgi:hypothetical protein
VTLRGIHTKKKKKNGYRGQKKRICNNSARRHPFSLAKANSASASSVSLGCTLLCHAIYRTDHRALSVFVSAIHSQPVQSRADRVLKARRQRSVDQFIEDGGVCGRLGLGSMAPESVHTSPAQGFEISCKLFKQI